MNLEDETRQQIIDLLETIETYRSEKADLEAKLAAHQRVADSFAEGADGILRLVTEIIEQRKLKAQLASANEAICGIRETLTVLAGLPDSKGFTHVAELHDTIKMAEFAKQALSSSPVCLHKEKLEKQAALLKVGRICAEDALEYIAYLQAALDAKNHEWQQAKEAVTHLEQGKPLGELVGKQTIVNQQAEISRLQAALDEANGKVM